jgi:hypothetical protein
MQLVVGKVVMHIKIANRQCRGLSRPVFMAPGPSEQPLEKGRDVIGSRGSRDGRRVWRSLNRLGLGRALPREGPRPSTSCST